MINIDKTDELYDYLTKLKVKDIDKLYTTLAQNGRYFRKDVQAYFKSIFEPSITKELDEKELEKVVDYYSDIKKLKKLRKEDLNSLLKNYKQGDKSAKEQIINGKLKDVLHASLNYKTLHEDVDIQDLVQVANIGLINAIDKYEIGAKIDLDDYITYEIWQLIKEEFERDRIC